MEKKELVEIAKGTIGALAISFVVTSVFNNIVLMSKLGRKGNNKVVVSIDEKNNLVMEKIKEEQPS